METQDILTPKDVAKLLRCSPAWTYKASSMGILPSIRIPCPGKGKKRMRNMVRFRKTDVLEFLEKHYSSDRG